VERLAPVGPVVRQARNNRETAGHWELYAEHRQRLTGAIVAALAAAGGGRVCILGAGNANDLDLAWLRGSAREVHLVDLDRGALARATARAGQGSAPLRAHGPIDLGGVVAFPRRWRSAPPSAADRCDWPTQIAASVAAAVPGSFEVVVSDCLLTQLYESCFAALGSVPWLADVLELVLATHLRVMLAIGAAGGRGLLATDAISSETYPLDELFGGREPLELLQALGRERRLFTGASPQILLRALREARPAGAEPARLVPPWLWREARTCTLLVYAVSFAMASTGDPGAITRSG
jgi:hypothetical protein